MTGRIKIASLLLLLQALAVCIVKADISITLKNLSESRLSDPHPPLKNYGSVKFFDTRFANIPSNGLTGYLHQPEPSNGCHPIPTIPGLNSEIPPNMTKRWFAIVNDFPSCEDAMLINVQNAGYSLVIVSGNSTINSLSKNTRNFGFPIVVVSKEYMEDTLITFAAADFTDPEVEATVVANADLFVVVMVLLFAFVVFPTCFLCCALCCYCHRVRRARAMYGHVGGIQQRRQTFDRLNQESLARRELIDSILRQLQQLELENEQRPLGKELTKKLPTQKYQRSSSIEACAICVDDLRDGDTLRILPCNHFFHIKCVDEWLSNHSDLCPLCKHQVPRDSNETTVRRGRDALDGNRRNLMFFTEDEDTDSDHPLVGGDRSAGITRERYGSI